MVSVSPDVDREGAIPFAQITIRIAIVDLSPWTSIASRRAKPPEIIDERSIVSRTDDMPASADPE
jgi:hypothetical protein